MSEILECPYCRKNHEMAFTCETRDLHSYMRKDSFTIAKLTQERDSLLEKLKLAEEKIKQIADQEYWSSKTDPKVLLKILDEYCTIARECLQKLRQGRIKVGTTVCNHGTPTDKKCELCES